MSATLQTFRSLARQWANAADDYERSFGGDETRIVAALTRKREVEARIEATFALRNGAKEATA